MRTSIGTAAAVVLAGLVATACTNGGGGATPPAGKPVTLGNIKLVSYTGCDDMLAGLRKATAENVGPWGIGGREMLAEDSATARTEAKSVPSYSTTNVHEAGVDEPDLVKTDGKRIITYSQGVLRVVDAAEKKVIGTVRIVPGEQRWASGDLLVHGDRALVLISGGGVVPLGAVAKRPVPAGPVYVLVDLKNLKVLGSITPTGAHVDARMTGSVVRVVVRSQPEITLPEVRQDEPEAGILERTRQAVQAAPIDAWLPKYEVTGPDGTTRQEKVACERVSHPETYTGTSMLTVHTIDLEAELGVGEPISVAADGDTVYATPTSLYVTSNPRWWFPRMIVEDAPSRIPPPSVEKGTATSGAASPDKNATAPDATASAIAPRDQPSTPPAEKVEPSNDPSMPSLLPEPTVTVTATATATVTAPGPTDSTATPSGSATTATPTPTGTATTPSAPPEQTEVHRFDITGTGAPRYVASGAVPGRLLNQYSLSEHEGTLRVATTSFRDQGTVASGENSSAVYTLKADTLAKLGEVTGLGEGERIYSVRFIGPVGYVVTFRQVDPLYTVDLRDPARPRVTGELKISGYSAYLHPAGDGRLLGIGQEASEQGRTLGTQISLFDVSDPAKPAVLSRFHQEGAGSEAEWDPHAFFYWPASGLAVLPLNNWGARTTEPRTAAMVLKIGDDAIKKTGMIEHPKTTSGRPAPDGLTVRRCLIIGDTLWTVSGAGLKASDATTLADQGWIPFSA